MSVVTFLTNIYFYLTKNNKENRKILKFSFHISQRSKVQTKVKSKVMEEICFTDFFYFSQET